MSGLYFSPKALLSDMIRKMTRDTDGRFKAGNSGNPSGRPARDRELAEAAREHTQAALDVLVQLLNKAKHESTRLQAAAELLNRGWGRAPQAINHEIKASLVGVMVDTPPSLSRAEWLKLHSPEPHIERTTE